MMDKVQKPNDSEVYGSLNSLTLSSNLNVQNQVPDSVLNRQRANYTIFQPVFIASLEVQTLQHLVSSTQTVEAYRVVKC
jgi:hypothetical protein